MNKILAIFDKETNQPWNIRIRVEGDGYGRDDAYKHEGEPTVEFYDARYTEKFGKLGQFVSSYYISTLLKNDDRTVGIDLDGGIDSWKVKYQAYNEVKDYLQAYLFHIAKIID